MGAAAVSVERDGAVLTATITRPEAHNALNVQVLDGIAAALDQAQSTSGVRAMIVTGAGSKAFSAGADLKEFVGIGTEAATARMRHGQAVMRRVELSPIPVIAAVNGLALGGGFELVLSCAFSVLSTSASLGLPEAGLGLVPGYGGTQRLPRRIGLPAAAHLMLSGARLDAGRAYELGLTPLPPVAPDDLTSAAIELAQIVAAAGPLAVRAILRALSRGLDGPIDAGLELETGLASLALSGSESDEGIAAFLERRRPDYHDPEAAP